jgi:3',5'-cyclic AMP phosphodiesterase CpdA
MANFCASQPQYRFPYRPTMTQPYVYWTLETPFATIIGLYSNVDGSLDGRGTNEQLRWFQQQLAAAPTDRCLLVAVHHPPYSLDAPHGGSPEILGAIDRAVQATNRYPDAIFSGHVHDYQRFTRVVGQRQIPYVVAGAGGYADAPRAMHQLQEKVKGQRIKTPFKTTVSEVTLESYNEDDPGFLRVTIDGSSLKGEYFVVPFNNPTTSSVFDSFVLDLGSHRLK